MRNSMSWKSCSLWTVVALIFIGTTAAEVFFRVKVKGSPELGVVKTELYRSDTVTQIVGNIQEFELRRVRTAYYFGTEGTNGQFHFLIKGNLGEADFLITWHRARSSKEVVIDKIELL
jgi:hypothetical protein